MKNLSLDLDSGRLSRWIGDPQEFEGWSDRYGDLYTLRVRAYRSSGSAVPDVDLQFLVKKPRRRDSAAQWALNSFSKVASFLSPAVRDYVGQVDVSGTEYSQALKLDSSPGNDVASVEYMGIIRAVTGARVVEAEFTYTLINSGYRTADAA